jgi:hypothetical protein
LKNKKGDTRDLILQVTGNTAAFSTIRINARSAAEADFDTEAFHFTATYDNSPGKFGFISRKANDIDGTESGLIAVFGMGLVIGVGVEEGGVQFFSTTDGSNWTATTSEPFRLQAVPGVPAGLPTHGRIAGLYRGHGLGTVLCIQ